MSDKKPVPLFVETNVRTCPICGKRAYSKEGVHPQCAMAKAGAKKKPPLPNATEPDLSNLADAPHDLPHDGIDDASHLDASGHES